MTQRCLVGCCWAQLPAAFPCSVARPSSGPKRSDLVVGGAAGMAGYMKEFVFPVIERQQGIRVVFDGTRSLVNLEKMRADRAAPRMSVRADGRSRHAACLG